jgi:predicted MFS family arabinose efflux permease
MVIEASTPSQRGLIIGISALTGCMIGAVLAPLILVGLATHLGWRAAFFVSGLPGLVAALAVARWVREAPAAPATETRQAKQDTRGGLDVLRIRNVWLCMVIASLLVAGQSVTMAFAPLLLVSLRHLQPAQMGVVMSAAGSALAAGMFILPVLSDRLGRKPILIGFAALAAMAVSALSWAGPAVPSTVIMAAAGIGFVAPMLSIGIIPGESVANSQRGTALGLTIAAAEIMGGFVAPPLAGLAADQLGQGVLPSIAAGCTLVGVLLAFALKETAPRRTGARDLALVPALTPSE